MTAVGGTICLSGCLSLSRSRSDFGSPRAKIGGTSYFYDSKSVNNSVMYKQGSLGKYAFMIKRVIDGGTIPGGLLDDGERADFSSTNLEELIKIPEYVETASQIFNRAQDKEGYQKFSESLVEQLGFEENAFAKLNNVLLELDRNSDGVATVLEDYSNLVEYWERGEEWENAGIRRTRSVKNDDEAIDLAEDAKRYLNSENGVYKDTVFEVHGKNFYPLYPMDSSEIGATGYAKGHATLVPLSKTFTAFTYLLQSAYVDGDLLDYLSDHDYDDAAVMLNNNIELMARTDAAISDLSLRLRNAGYPRVGIAQDMWELYINTDDMKLKTF